MNRCILQVILMTSLITGSVQASGFGMVRRPVAVSGYYTPTVVYYPVASPVICSVPIMPVAPSRPMQPILVPSAPFAVPRAAPPSSSPEPPLSNPPADDATTRRVGESFYDVLPGPVGMTRDGGRCSIAFWNLTGRTLTLRIDGRDVTLQPSKSVTLEVPSTFAWQIVGREGEATRIPPDRGTAEVLIRR